MNHKGMLLATLLLAGLVVAVMAAAPAGKAVCPDCKDGVMCAACSAKKTHAAHATLVIKLDVALKDLSAVEKAVEDGKIKSIDLHTPFCYILSGGVAFRSLTPACFYNLCRRMEGFLESQMNCWAMFATITLSRKGDRP